METEKIKITEEQNVHAQWYEDAKKQNLETLPNFISHLMNDYKHDYGTICHALAAGATATMWAMNKHPQGGITGFQAGAIMWEVVRHWQYSSNKCGLRMLNYDNMLFPQHADDYQKTISPGVWDALKKEAKKKMDEADIDFVNQSVYDHWSSIVDGKVPFGFKVRQD
jgi:hypothetical protein